MTDELPTPPAGPPPGWEVPTPGGTPPPTAPRQTEPTPAPTSPPPTAPPPYPQSASASGPAAGRTEPFAIVSLVVALAGWVLCLLPVTGIVAVVFGHLARSRTKRNGTKGRGMALAGVIVGYVQIVVGVIAIVTLIVVVVISINDTSDAHDRARDLGHEIQKVAARDEIPTQSTEAVQRAIRESGLDPDDVRLPTSDRKAVDASSAQLDGEAWRLRVSTSVLGSACLTVPRNVSANFLVRDEC